MVLYFFSCSVTNFKSLFKSFNASIRWFSRDFRLDRRGAPPRGISDKGTGEDALLFGCDSGSCPSLSWILAAEIIPRSQLRCHNALILYVFKACFSNYREDFHCYFNVFLDQFPYHPRSLSSPRLSHFISFFGTSELTAFFVLDSFTSRSNSLSSSSSSSQCPSHSHLHFRSNTMLQICPPYCSYQSYRACRLCSRVIHWEPS